MKSYDKNAFSTIDGITKREYFVAMAMTGMLSNPGHRSTAISPAILAGDAIRYADELLNQLNPNETKRNPKD